MCRMCDGKSWEEIDRQMDLTIRVNGFQMLQVGGPRPWTYTIGARESWERPDLLVVDIDPGMQAAMVAALADDYREHGHIRPSTRELLDLDLVTVDERHLREGLVAAWEARYSMAATTGDFLQIVPGTSWFCDGCAPKVRRLD